MQTEKRRKAGFFSARIMLNIAPETLARLEREAEQTQQTLASVARVMIARGLAQDAKRRPAESPSRDGVEARAA